MSSLLPCGMHKLSVERYKVCDRSVFFLLPVLGQDLVKHFLLLKSTCLSYEAISQ